MAKPEPFTFSREIPVREEADVLVAGGGPAGVTAAVAAARAGASVLLVEAHTCLGGMGTAGLVPMFCMFSDGVNFLAGGLGREIYDLCWKHGSVAPDDHVWADKKRHSISIRAEILKRIYDRLVTGSGARLLLGTQVIAAETDGDRVALTVCAAKSGLFAVRARIFVDATGDGDFAARAGAHFEKGDPDGRLQPGTLCSLWAGIDWDTARAHGSGDGWPKGQRRALDRAIADGVFSVPDPHLPGIWRCGETVGGGNIGHTFGVDGTDERSLTEALVHGWATMLEYERYYKDYLKGFERMELVATGALLGIRETRRIAGDYCLSLDDFQARAVFDDEIGRYNYPVDIHASTADDPVDAESMMRSYRCADGESYGIPYRSLVVKGLANLLVAGRCVSADRYVQGSLRVMPGCFITGQAAGVAAALAARAEGATREVRIADLKDRLLAMGAYLPNA